MNSNKNRPPRWGIYLLNLFIRSDYSEEIQGDLTEAFGWRLEEKGTTKAHLKFAWEVFWSLRPSNLKSYYHIQLNTMIIRNYLKIAFRNLWLKKSTSFINIFGLSIGVAAFLFIVLYTHQILTFNHVHENRDRIFMPYKERITPDGIQETFDTWVPLRKKLIDTYSHVISSSHVYETEARVIKENRYIDENILYADDSFFSIFSIDILFGNKDNIFPHSHSIIISEDVSFKYFNKKNSVGEEIELYLPDDDTSLRFDVTAIISNFPENVSHQPDFIIEMESLPFYSEYANEWGTSFLETYVLLDKPESAALLESEFPTLIESIFDSETKENTNFKLLPMAQFYDQFIGSRSNALILFWIGVGILLIAIINFINLTTAQSSSRAKEIGLRKVLGAFRQQIRTQFLTEAFVLTIIACTIGFLLVFLLLPIFNNYFGVTLNLSKFSIVELGFFMIGLIISLGILSGVYTAFYLSSIRAIDVLRRRLGFNGMHFKNILVIVQFSIALFLIAGTLIVRRQIEYMTEKDMGFDGEGIMTIAASPSDFEDFDSGLIKLNTFKNQLLQKSFVKQLSCSRAVPTFWTRSFLFVRPDGWEGDPLRMRYTFLDEFFFDTYGIPIKYGTGFIANEAGSRRGNVILNEAAAKAFNFNPFAENFIKIGDSKIPVIGITEDFHFESLENEVAPTLMFYRSPQSESHRHITIKINTASLVNKIEMIEEMWNQLGSTQAFTFSFMDDRIDEIYENEKRYLAMVTLFSIISIVVACLGLYGLTIFIVEKKRKEISIKKVLGADISMILRMIFGHFAKWIGIAFLISIPFSIYFGNDWLQSYFYRVSIGWTTYLFALAIVLALTILTVGYHSLRAALANPVKYLKED